MIQQNSVEVSIVGAGPVGLFLAQKLNEKNIEFEIFEEHSEVGRPVQCAGLVSRNLEELIKISKKAVLNKVKGARLYPPSGKVIEFTRKNDEAYVIDRSIFDKELAKGLDIIFNYRVEKLDFNSKYIVGADGPNSKVAELARFPPLKDVLVGVQYEIENKNYEKDFVELYFGNSIAPKFFAWIIPTNKTLRIGLATRNNASSFLDAFVSKKFGEVEIVEQIGGLIPIKWRDSFVKENIALVGDAAGQVKPTTGGGIYIGCLSAAILANSIAEHNLNLYELAWRERIEPEFIQALQLMKIFRKLSDKELNHVFEILNKPKVKELILEYGDMDRPAKLIKNVIKEPQVWELLPYLRYLW